MPSRSAGRPRKARKGSARPAATRKARSGAARPSDLKASRPGGRTARPAPTARPGRVLKSRLRPAALARAAVKARPLTKRELEEFRRQLEAERDRLSAELDAMEEHLPEVEQVSVDASGGYDEDLADVASDTFEREKGIAIENSVQDLLQQVEEALERIDQGTFGVCEACGSPIHPERLRALPYARLCIDCKAREEQAIPR